MTKRELRLARRAAEVETRPQEAGAAGPPPAPRRCPPASRRARRARRGRRLPRSRRRAAAAAPRTRAEPAANGRDNLLTSRSSSRTKQHEFPDRADDWVCIFFLREHGAEADGSVPSTFDGLIQDTFAELVS